MLSLAGESVGGGLQRNQSEGTNENSISLTQIAIWLIVAGHVLFNGTLQVAFFTGGNVFGKYTVGNAPDDAVSMLEVARNAYYAKSAFLLLLVILLAARVWFSLSLAISLSTYAITMASFFGFTYTTVVYLLGALLLVGTYLYDGRPRRLMVPMYDVELASQSAESLSVFVPQCSVGLRRVDAAAPLPGPVSQR
jgi:hypothetical protein